MFSFFKKQLSNTLDWTTAFGRNVLKPFTGNLSYAFAATITSTLSLAQLPIAEAKFWGGDTGSCFEDKDHHDNTLRAVHGESDLIALLKKECGIFNDAYNDCAEFLVNSIEFGKGTFGGHTCELVYHAINTPDPCVVNTIQNNCQNGYGTFQDILATAGIAAGAALLIASGIWYARRQQRAALNVANNATPPEEAASIESTPYTRLGGGASQV